jgi:hypothetical protein
MKKLYGFDGIDIDVESSLTTPLLSSFRKIFKILHTEGEIISMAPESPSLNPAELKIFQEGSLNSYVPLVDSTIINYVTFVAPQLYNDAVQCLLPTTYYGSTYYGSTYYGSTYYGSTYYGSTMTRCPSRTPNPNPNPDPDPNPNPNPNQVPFEDP